MPTKKPSPPTPTSLPRSKTDEDENEVYWDQTQPRRHPPSSTPLKAKPKRDCAAAEMPSPSKTATDDDPSASPEESARAPQLIRRDTLERRSLRLNKRLKERQPSSAENEPASSTTASTAVRDIPGIDVLLNRLKEKERGGTKGKAKANGSIAPVQNQNIKSPQRQPKSTPTLRRTILAPATDTPPIHKRVMPTRSPASLLRTTVSKPGLGSNQETPTRASAHLNSGPLMSKPINKAAVSNIRPSNIPLAGTSRAKPANGTVVRPGPAQFKPPSMIGVAKVATTNTLAPAAIPRNNSTFSRPSATTALRGPVGQMKPPSMMGVAKVQTTTVRPPTAIPKTTSTLSRPLNTVFRAPSLVTNRPPIKAPALPPPTRTFQIRHDESESLLSGLSAEDLAWNSDD